MTRENQYRVVNASTHEVLGEFKSGHEADTFAARLGLPCVEVHKWSWEDGEGEVWSLVRRVEA